MRTTYRRRIVGFRLGGSARATLVDFVHLLEVAERLAGRFEQQRQRRRLCLIEISIEEGEEKEEE